LSSEKNDRLLFLKLSFIKEQIRFVFVIGTKKFIALESSVLCHLFFFVFELRPKVITDINELTHYVITNSALSLSISIEKCEIYKTMLTMSVFIQAESNNIKEESIQTRVKAR
jgi:hypothetical protein